MHLCCVLISAHHRLFQYQPRHFTQRESLNDVLMQSIDWVHYCRLRHFSTKFKTDVNCVLHVYPSIKRRCIRSSNYVTWWFEIACWVFCNEAKMWELRTHRSHIIWNSQPIRAQSMVWPTTMDQTSTFLSIAMLVLVTAGVCNWCVMR
jgi:hypothetical protein